jgi:spore coat polysaccharide biosynthesis protein SpsF
MKVLAIIQARMGSTRLPGKVLMPLGGKPMLERIVSRVRRCRNLTGVMVATTVEPGDDLIAQWCEQAGCPYFRGSQDDVLDRYYQAARPEAPDAVVRITSDCPLIDPGVVDDLITLYREKLPDYATNVFPLRTFPRGLDTEVVSFQALEHIWRVDTDPSLREHVTYYIEKNAESFRIECLSQDQDLSYHRWTVDTAEDLAFAQAIYERFPGDAFTWKEVLALIEREPALAEINAHIQQKQV